MSQMTLFFNHQGKSLTIQCLDTDTLNQVYSRYCIKANMNRDDPKFYYNSMELKGDDKALKDHNIVNRGNFNVVIAKYVVGA